MKLKQSIAEVLYSFFQLFYRIIFRIYFRWEIYGLEHVPPEGGAILAVNHSSALDPPLGGTALRRKIWYVGRSSLVKNRFIDFIFFAQHLIPITLGRPDVNATKKIIKMITSGEIVLMFPEGTRSCDGTLGPGREGIGMFVSHARADVLPCYISGSWRALPKGAILPRPRKIRVAYGPLIRYGEFEGVPAGREGFARISGTIMERIAELKEALES